tara:strand:- start:486 stop:677 length:192 start_codon:yes stop_codon:yes gene_type:complete
MPLIGVGASGNNKSLIIGLTIIVSALTIIVHLKNLKKMDSEEKSNAVRLATLEEKVSTLENQQ